MTAPYVLLAPAVVGALALPARLLPARMRDRAALALCFLGCALALAAAAMAPLEGWRTTRQDARVTVLVAAAALTMWIVTAVAVPSSRRLAWTAATGIGASALALAAAGEWLAPSALFWLCASAACAVGAAHDPWKGRVWGALFVADALVVSAFALTYLDTETWSVAGGIGGPSHWLVVGAALVRVVLAATVAARSGPALGVAPAAPFLAASAFALLGTFGARSEPWLAAASLGAALVCGATFAVAARAGVDTAALLLALAGLALADPAVAAVAGASACLALGARLIAVAMGWPSAGALLVCGLLPPGAALLWWDRVLHRSVEEATGAAPEVAAPWSLVAACAVLFVLVVPALVARSALVRLGSAASQTTVAGAVVVGGATLALAFLALPDVSPAALWELQPARHDWALGAAVVAASGAWGITWMRNRQRPRPGPVRTEPSSTRFPARAEIIAGYAAVVLGVAAVAGAVALTVVGLKMGFL